MVVKKAKTNFEGGKMRHILLVAVLVLYFVFSGCGAPKPEGTIDKNKDHANTPQPQTDADGFIRGLLKLSKPTAHGGVDIEVSADFPFEPAQVSFGLRNYGINLIPSKKTAIGNKWSDLVRSPEQTREGLISKPTVFDIIVVAKSKDGSESVSYLTQLTVVPEPTIEVKYNRMKIGQPQIVEVQSSEPISSVTLISPRGDKIPFITTDKKLFKLDVTLQPAKDGFAAIHAEDDMGLSFDKTLYVDDPTQKRIYFVEESGVRNSSDTLYEKPVFSAMLDGKDIAISFYMRIPVLPNPYLVGLLKYSNKNKLGASRPYLQGISPDKRWLAINASKSLSFEKDYMEDGRKLDDIEATYLLLYNVESSEIKRIGEPRYKKHFKHAEYGALIKESGPLYFPVFWDENELILLEQTKENKFYAESSPDPKVTNNGIPIQVPYAKARGVSISMKDFKLTPTDKFKPLTPWVVYADQATGVVCYTDPFVPIEKGVRGTLPSSLRLSDSIPYLVSDLSGNHSYVIHDTINLYSPSKYHLANYVLYSTILIDNQPIAIIVASFGEDRPDLEGVKEIDPNNQPKRKVICFKLNLYTGKIETISDLGDMKFMPIYTRCGTGDDKIMIISTKYVQEIINFDEERFFIIVANKERITEQIGERIMSLENVGVFVR